MMRMTVATAGQITKRWAHIATKEYFEYHYARAVLIFTDNVERSDSIRLKSDYTAS